MSEFSSEMPVRSGSSFSKKIENALTVIALKQQKTLSRCEHRPESSGPQFQDNKDLRDKLHPFLKPFFSNIKVQEFKV